MSTPNPWEAPYLCRGGRGVCREGGGGTTQAKLLTSDGRRLYCRKSSDISHLDRQMGPSAGSASQICCRRRARQAPNCIALGVLPLSVEAFTDGVAVYRSSLELNIKRSLQLI